ncbi:MAG: hypothetical protein JSS81_00660 [Acidobacteria bacterium]|nr:hypothetical protein [Acidobacteriota bacterium]
MSDWSAGILPANAAPAVSNVTLAFNIAESETFVRAGALMATGTASAPVRRRAPKENYLFDSHFAERFSRMTPVASGKV